MAGAVRVRRWTCARCGAEMALPSKGPHGQGHITAVGPCERRGCNRLAQRMRGDGNLSCFTHLCSSSGDFERAEESGSAR